MKGDFTRSTWDPKKRHASVRMQQGRVQVDADWNEQADILEYLRETGTADVVGRCGAPETGGGFAIGVSDDGDDLTLSPGRIYVDGILCELEEGATAGGQPVSYRNQPDYPGAPLPSELAEEPEPLDGPYLVYLDVWRRHLTAIEDPEIRERALGGPDTATRTRTVAQVKLFPATDVGEVGCASDLPGWSEETAPSSGRLRARVQPGEEDEGPCVVPAAAGYTRLENQLYRVEVHGEGGLGEATFKWSRDNGAVATAWLGQDETDPDRLLVASTGPDELTGFHGASWVELTDDDRELRGEPGILVRVVKVDGDSIEIDPGGETVDFEAAGPHPKLRRWDLPAEAAGALSVEQAAGNQGYLRLESGIEIRFEAGTYRSGDYWQIPARAFVGELVGDIEWPQESPGQGEARPPAGIHHHYCRLALVEFDGASFSGEPTDCRPRFPALTEMVDLSYVGGTGQSALPGRELACPLQARVSNGKWPVAGARVQFILPAGGGTLRGAPGPTVTATADPASLILTSNSRGQVRCVWQLPSAPPAGPDGGRRCLRVVARLVDDTLVEAPSQSVFFNAEVALASEVSYDPSDCPPLAEAGADTVQRAIDELCRRSGVREPGIGIEEVRLSDGRPVDFEDDVNTAFLSAGLAIACDRPIAPEAFASPERGGRVPARPNCTVSLDLPYPLASENFWDINEGSVGFHEVTLAANVEVDGNTIIWRPRGDAQEFLRGRLFGFLNAPNRPIADRVLVHLRLKGNFIWLEGDGGEPEMYLDGEIYGRAADDGRVAGRWPSGNGVAGGDFEMWFWVTPESTTTPTPTRTFTATGFPTPTLTRTFATGFATGIVRGTGVVLRTTRPPIFSPIVSPGPVAPTTEVRGIGAVLSERLASGNIGNLGELAAADPPTVAAALGISEERAGEFIGAARELLEPGAGRPATEVSGIGDVLAARLADGGIGGLGQLAAAEPARVAELLGVSEVRAMGLVEAARNLLEE